MDEPTEQPPEPEGKYEPCGQCSRGWDVTAGRPCPCYAAHLNEAVTECLRRAQEQPK